MTTNGYLFNENLTCGFWGTDKLKDKKFILKELNNLLQKCWKNFYYNISIRYEKYLMKNYKLLSKSISIFINII